MPKPSEVPEWATSATYTGGPEAGTNTKTDPGASRKAEGWEPAAKPPAQEFNWWWNLVGSWVDWLDSFFTIDGSDNLTLPAGLTTTAGVTTGTAGVTVGANQHVTVSGTGELKHGDRKVRIPGMAGRATDGGTVSYPFSGYDNAIATGSAATLAWPAVFKDGDRIKSVAFRVEGNGTVDLSNIDINTVDQDGGNASLFAGSQNNISATPQTITCNVTDHTMAAGETLLIALVVNATGLTVYWVEITYDRP